MRLKNKDMFFSQDLDKTLHSAIKEGITPLIILNGEYYEVQE